ncbi:MULTISPECIES: hypothetical protein [Streptomyces violaceusniger group]|uniref:Uncharacterized protein n=2 Tax=Streptomyces rapamycinicus TaxID=1226757 RepID=A0A0A0NA26_STRRN|nr:hypothetical protein [Streptomyces rapamycinicus]AGP52933.1 hypothetical protein M271_06545 [Streptomyces rapamycinicus NRRL 5491]MBB4780410.1 hypothetical protein [Streptomyces rapamycinicus]RLV74936.1 hypothetical protein D3C57_136960 [Streptomyces rapamycinicus NRRL 5491]
MADILTTVLVKLAQLALEALVAQLAKTLLTAALRPTAAPAAA